MQESQHFSVVKSKIIQTSRIVEMCKTKQEQLAKASQAFANLKALHDTGLNRCKRLEHDNRLLGFRNEALASKLNEVCANYDKVVAELQSVKPDYERLQKSYNEQLIECRRVEGLLGRCTCRQDFDESQFKYRGTRKYRNLKLEYDKLKKLAGGGCSCQTDLQKKEEVIEPEFDDFACKSDDEEVPRILRDTKIIAESDLVARFAESPLRELEPPPPPPSILVTPPTPGAESNDFQASFPLDSEAIRKIQTERRRKFWIPNNYGWPTGKLPAAKKLTGLINRLIKAKIDRLMTSLPGRRKKKLTNLTSETESELERLFDDEKRILGRNRRLVALAKRQNPESSDSEPLDSGLVTASPKNSTDTDTNWRPLSIQSDSRLESKFLEDSSVVEAIQSVNVARVIGAPQDFRLESKLLEDSSVVEAVQSVNVARVDGAPQDFRLESKFLEDSSFVEGVQRANVARVDGAPQDFRLESKLLEDFSVVEAMQRVNVTRVDGAPQDFRLESKLLEDFSVVEAMQRVNVTRVDGAPQDSPLESKFLEDSSVVETVQSVNVARVDGAPQDSRLESKLLEDSSFVETVQRVNVTRVDGAPQDFRLESKLLEDSSVVEAMQRVNVTRVDGAPQDSRLESKLLEDSSVVEAVELVNFELLVDGAPQDSRLKSKFLEDPSVEAAANLTVSESNLEVDGAPQDSPVESKIEASRLMPTSPSLIEIIKNLRHSPLLSPLRRSPQTSSARKRISFDSLEEPRAPKRKSTTSEASGPQKLTKPNTDVLASILEGMKPSEAKPHSVSKLTDADRPKSPDLIELPSKLPRLIPLERRRRLSLEEAEAALDRLIMFSASELIADDVATLLSGLRPSRLARLVLEKLRADAGKATKSSKPYCPALTQLQRTLLGLLRKLDRSACPGILDEFLSLAEKRGRKEHNNNVTRLFAAACKMRHDVRRARQFVLRSFYYKKNLAPLSVLLVTLKTYPEVLPHGSNEPLVEAVVQICLGKLAAGQMCLKLQPLGDLLKNYYNYAQQPLDAVFDKFFRSYIQNPTSRQLQCALLLLLRHQRGEWALDRMRRQFWPLYAKVPGGNANLKATLVLFIAKACLGLDEATRQWFEQLLQVESHPLVKRSLAYALRQNYPDVGVKIA